MSEFKNSTPSSYEVDAMLEENIKLKAQAEDLKIRLDAGRMEIASLREKVNDLEQNYIQLDFAYNCIIRSLFWKTTKPLRIILNLIKTALKRIKIFYYPLKALKILLTKGPKKLFKHMRKHFKSRLPREINYISKERRAKEEATVFPKDIKFSLLVPLYNTPLNFLQEMIDSVKAQTYKNWELCLADGSDSEHSEVEQAVKKYMSEDDRIIYKKLEQNLGISENTNECIYMSTGDYIGLFDHDDVLHPSALFEYMKVICEDDADFIYCDEDKIKDLKSRPFDAYYKTDFAVDNLRANNYICHFTAFKKSLLKKSGLFRKEFDGSQDHDLVLRLTEHAEHIIHIPKILYHWRVSSVSVASDPYAKPYTIKAGKKAVAEHLERVGLKGTVTSSTFHPNIYRVKYDIIGEPLVSIIIPNYNHILELSRCIDSILNLTTYKNYEIIIVENNSNEETFRYYETLKRYNNIKVVVYKPVAGFNYSAINNYGVQFAKGEHYILLNNDIEIITPNWIEEMLMYSQRSDVGCVGAMLYYPNNTIQHAGVVVGLLTLAGHAFKHYPRGSAGYFGRAAFQQNVSAVTAACLMLSADIYKEVNGLDETFEVAFNDIDFCLRIREKGYLNVFTPYAELYHHESISRGDEDTPAKKKRFAGEVRRFQMRWKNILEKGDPYYNPNLTLDSEDFSPKG